MWDAIILSDIHLGSENCQAKALTQFLEEVLAGRWPTARLILNGDVFDSIDFRRLKKSHWKVLSLLRKLSDKIDIIWLVGNHDGSAEVVSHLLGVRVEDEYILTSGDCRLMVLHGHVFDNAPISHEAAVMPVYVFFEYLIWGSIIVFIYVNRRNALRARAHMNAAHVQRAETQRRAIESRLQVLQARVEPKFLFDTLAQVRDLYEGDPATGSRMLGDLIVYLRAALPHLRESTSTLGQEVDLVGAYVAIMRTHLGDAVSFHVEVTDLARAARMPAMVLLPLVNHALVHRLARRAPSGAIGVAARNAEGRLRVEIADSGEGFVSAAGSDDLRDVRERLHTLYSGAETLAFERSGNGGSRVLVEIPYESSDRSHR